MPFTLFWLTKWTIKFQQKDGYLYILFAPLLMRINEVTQSIPYVHSEIGHKLYFDVICFEGMTLTYYLFKTSRLTVVAC